MSEKPLLTIITPVYNGSKTLDGLVDSLLSLDCLAESGEVEWLVTDDGSTDNSIEILESSMPKFKNFETKIFTQKNLGPGSARNTALSNANGKWVFLLDRDDTLNINPLPLLKSVEAKDVTCMHFAVDFFKLGKHVKRRPPLPLKHFKNKKTFLDLMTADNYFTICSLIFRRDLVEHKFDDEHRYLEDWLFFGMNFHLFDNMMIFRNKVLANINFSHSSLSTDFKSMARHRDFIADALLSHFKGELTGKQINNLYVQKAIAKKMSSGVFDFKAFFLFPVAPFLYFKLIVYYFLWPIFHSINFFRSH